MMRPGFHAFLCLLFLGATSVRTSRVFADEGAKAKKTIDFEGEVVEGLNQEPLDAMNAISDKKERAKHSHLYLKRKDFRDNSDELVRELLELR